MKNKIFSKILGIFALILMFGCEPYMDDKPESGTNLPPDPGTMNFSITPGADEFHYKVELASPELNGISVVSFNLGNGTTVKASSGIGYYPLPGEYTITMTITTNGGSSTISKKHTTTKTDYTIFTDEKYVFLTGGANNANGKSWVLDAEMQGHLGVGPAGGNPLEWWSAQPFNKTGTGAYDDELVFNLNGFKVTYDNHGVSYVKGYMKDDPKLASLYKNPRQNKDDWDVDYATPVAGTWSINEKPDGFYLKISSDKRIFPGLDVGATNDEYKILNITENSLELSCPSAYENWTNWHFLLKPKNYERPKIEYSVNIQAESGINTYGMHFTVNNIPSGQTINKIAVDFGDGNTEETSDVNEVLTNTYLRKGSYSVTVTVSTSLGVESKSFPVNITDNHPDYVEFQLGEIVMYNDFSEVIMVPFAGQDCFVATADNPSRIYPNKSTKVGYYSKTNNQWANAYMKLPSGYRFDLRQQHIFSIKVYGKAGDVVLLKLENTDKGGNSWQTGTFDVKYTIKKDNTWEYAQYDFSGVGAGWDWTGDIFTGNVVTDDRFNHNFYNVVRIMLNPGVGNGTHEMYFDELAGPHVEGIKSATIK